MGLKLKYAKLPCTIELGKALPLCSSILATAAVCEPQPHTCGAKPPGGDATALLP